MSEGRLLDASWLLLTLAVIGYGYRVWYALVWITALVALGWFVAHHSGVPISGSRHERLGLWYSLDRLLSIIELRRKHYEIDLESSHRFYFYFHSMMGYVLATFLLASLSGCVG